MILINKFLLVIGLVFIFSSCDQKIAKSKQASMAKSIEKEHKHESYYTCSMHPQVKEKKAGKCPICHMNLTKIEIDTAEPEDISDSEIKRLWACRDFPDVTSEKKDVCPIDGSPMVILKDDESKAGKVMARVKLRKAQLSHFSPELFPVTSMKMVKKVRLLGEVLRSEDKESKIAAQVSARIEKVYVKSTGAFINKGDLILEIYSPELISSGTEYINVRKSLKKKKNRHLKDLLKQSEERLTLWGVKKFQLEGWFSEGSVPNSIKVYSTTSGIVQKRNAVVGKYIKEGDNFFELSDLSSIWVEMDVYEHDSGIINLEQHVDLSFSALPGKRYSGTIDFISPVLNSKTRTLKVRTTVNNPKGLLKPGMVADAVLTIEYAGTPLVVPRSAIIDTGKRKVVWKKISKVKFQAINVETGIESEGYTEIISGVAANDEIVIEGNFLLDAQAQLFGGYEDFKTK